MKTPDKKETKSFFTFIYEGVEVLVLHKDGTLVLNEHSGFSLNEAAKLFFEELSRLVVENKGEHETTPQN